MGIDPNEYIETLAVQAHRRAGILMSWEQCPESYKEKRRKEVREALQRRETDHED